MRISVCKLDFREYLKSKLSNFANGVRNGIFNNPSVFTTPPIAADEFMAIIAQHNSALAEYNTLGRVKKAAYYEAVNKLIGALNTLAVYVDSIAQGNESIILLAGFQPTSTTSQASPALEKIEVIRLTPSSVDGQALIDTPAIKNKGVTGYGLILKSGAPLSVQDFDGTQLRLNTSADETLIIDFGKNRKKVVNGLDNLTTYYAYMVAINPTGVSPLSNALKVKTT